MQIEVGQIVEGKVTGITNFGVFVDLGAQKTNARSAHFQTKKINNRFIS
mgnify:CR=1 FL=1